MDLIYRTASAINETYPGVAPIALADVASGRVGGEVQIAALANDTDADGHTLYIARYSDPLVNGQVQGSLRLIDNKFYLSTEDDRFDFATSLVTFSYTAVDEWGAESNPVTVSVTVTSEPVPGVPETGQTLIGLNKPNTIEGGSGNDYIRGGNNKDVLSGLAGADKIYGENGTDSLNGGAGRDLLDGGNGKDTLDGGAGDDTLTGGNSPDLFILGYERGRDVITDFETKNGSGDQIQVSPFHWLNFASLKANAQASAQSPKDLVITSEDGSYQLLLKNFSLSALNGKDFIFG